MNKRFEEKASKILIVLWSIPFWIILGIHIVIFWLVTKFYERKIEPELISTLLEEEE